MNYQPHAAFAPTSRPDPRDFLAVADAIGCAMVRDAVWGGDRCNWFVWMKEPVAGRFASVYRAAGPDLYSGTSGIALFLSRLAAITGDRHQRRTAQGAARQVKAQIGDGVSYPIGLYTGALGAGWAVTQIGECLEDAGLIEAGLAVVETAAMQSAPPEALDFLSGRAGAIVALLGLGRRYKRPELVERARSLGTQLLQAAEPSPQGTSWPFGSGATRNLLGLSHGTAGIALALFELAAATSDERYRETARAALRYERHHFDRLRVAWPDFRTMPGQPAAAPSYPVAWCHGSIGIGLSRLRIRELEPDDPMILPEIDAAIAAAVRCLNAPTETNVDFTLCHGLLGTNEFLLLVGEKFGRAEAFAAAHQVALVGMTRCHRPRNPWPCGVPDAGETPSLMLGTAGVGLHYLRLYDPSASPSIVLPTAAME